MTRKHRSRWLLWIGIAAVVLLFVWSMETRRVVIRTDTFQESAAALDDADRGFYYIHGFRIDAEPVGEEEMEKRVWLQYWNDVDTKLTLLEVNLSAFRDGPINDAGLGNLELMFSCLETTGKHYILRFLYDWDGEIALYEPAELETILTHMAQVGPVVSRYHDRIYTMQGLFFGNWGEMNGSPFSGAESMTRLAHALAQATADDIFLSVRMPAQWRRVTAVYDPLKADGDTTGLAVRLGLFNDGMMGSETDYGTYFFTTQEEAGPTGIWTREEELAFQEQLCRRVPNGGEIIVDNPYNDFENAVRDMARMHVSYLNLEYDRHVLDKWAETTIQDGSCYDGMDGLTWVDRHLGYRFLIDETIVTRLPVTRWAVIDVNLANVGFAPIYDRSVAEMRLVDASGQVMAEAVCGDLRSLTGRYRPFERFTARLVVDTRDMKDGEYRVYLNIRNTVSGDTIGLANTQEPDGEYGILVGRMVIGNDE